LFQVRKMFFTRNMQKDLLREPDQMGGGGDGGA